MPGILEGKKILVTGVLTPASIAFAIADTAQKEGADIVLTSFGRVMSLTEKSARRMKPTPDILEMDVNNVFKWRLLTKMKVLSSDAIIQMKAMIKPAPEATQLTGSPNAIDLPGNRSSNPIKVIASRDRPSDPARGRPAISGLVHR